MKHILSLLSKKGFIFSPHTYLFIFLLPFLPHRVSPPSFSAVFGIFYLFFLSPLFSSSRSLLRHYIFYINVHFSVSWFVFAHIFKLCICVCVCMLVGGLGGGELGLTYFYILVETKCPQKDRNM